MANVNKFTQMGQSLKRRRHKHQPYARCARGTPGPRWQGNSQAQFEGRGGGSMLDRVIDSSLSTSAAPCRL